VFLYHSQKSVSFCNINNKFILAVFAAIANFIVQLIIMYDSVAVLLYSTCPNYCYSHVLQLGMDK